MASATVILSMFVASIIVACVDGAGTSRQELEKRSDPDQSNPPEETDMPQVPQDLGEGSMIEDRRAAHSELEKSEMSFAGRPFFKPTRTPLPAPPSSLTHTSNKRESIKLPVLLSDSNEFQLKTRRYPQKPLPGRSPKPGMSATSSNVVHIPDPNPWCSIAPLCKRTFVQVCGFDDRFGFAQFEDICHVLQVNCYWKYNFSVLTTCKLPL